MPPRLVPGPVKPAGYRPHGKPGLVPESMARQFPNSPFAVDVSQAADQFGLRAANFEDLLNNIIPGSVYSP